MSSSTRIETLDHPSLYTTQQLERARRVLDLLGRARLVLCEMPGG
jgi:hypothetical protein